MFDPRSRGVLDRPVKPGDDSFGVLRIIAASLVLAMTVFVSLLFEYIESELLSPAKPRRTGYPACAGYDDCGGAKPRTTVCVVRVFSQHSSARGETLSHHAPPAREEMSWNAATF
jgi:hypothetical protein